MWNCSRGIQYSVSWLFEACFSSKGIRCWILIVISYIRLLVLLIYLNLLHLLWELLLLSWITTIVTVVYTSSRVPRKWCNMLMLLIAIVISLYHWVILVICLLCSVLSSTASDKCSIDWILTCKSIRSDISLIALCIDMERHLCQWYVMLASIHSHFLLIWTCSTRNTFSHRC